MKTTKNKLRESVRRILREIFLSRLIDPPEGEEEEEYSIAQRIGGRHTSRAATGVDYGGFTESDEDEDLDESEE